jgi:hypothetical protein
VDAGSGLTVGDEAGRWRPVITGRMSWPAAGQLLMRDGVGGSRRHQAALWSPRDRTEGVWVAALKEPGRGMGALP